ncbi:CRISPR-associated protein Cas4 [Geoglobus ahangari]|uniref:CRISPR-associated exonuclease Cas4 n=1 Tax=Geoglobus ahangari TaxID=113653 RepID=A0A0F7IG88_9EURY|nr:CRISPR-associated protein Cas4 [Geoglobus ahangari]AKG92222.1 CRISPR-associated protein Cas4 [Geoglobus ahangari]
MIDEMYIRGVQVNYYFVCKTKLWLFSHNVGMENESDAVKLGKLIHRSVFDRDEKEIRIGPIAIDAVRKGDVVEIREVKKSRAFEKASYYQLLYYLYYLSKLGIRAVGKLSYPKQRKNVEVILDESSAREMESVLDDIPRVVNGEMPRPVYKKHCRKCAYFEFCFT